MRVNVLGRLFTGGMSFWSQPVEVVLDGGAPRVDRLELSPGRQIAHGGELAVSAWASDAELSGVTQVEVGFDVDRSGEFSEKVPPVQAEIESNVRWVAKLGSQTYGNATVAHGKVFVGTNNESARDSQHQGDRSILLCFDEKTGAFLWQLVRWQPWVWFWQLAWRLFWEPPSRLAWTSSWVSV